MGWLPILSTMSLPLLIATVLLNRLIYRTPPTATIQAPYPADWPVLPRLGHDGVFGCLLPGHGEQVWTEHSWSLTLPPAAVLYIAMTADSAIRHRRGGGAQWKGRILEPAKRACSEVWSHG
jgi:hypothetical protein